jgi:hypothetical protein
MPRPAAWALLREYSLNLAAQKARHASKTFHAATKLTHVGHTPNLLLILSKLTRAVLGNTA